MGAVQKFSMTSDLGECASRDKQECAERFDAVIIGVLVGLTGDKAPLVAYPGNPSSGSVLAKTTTVLSTEDLGSEIALLFENGDPQRPVVIGPLHKSVKSAVAEPKSEGAQVELDGDKLFLRAKKEIVLRCGDASITLTRPGKIVIRGASLFSRSTGLNRIKGGAVQIN